MSVLAVCLELDRVMGASGIGTKRTSWAGLAMDPKLLDILVRRISKDALEFGLDAAGIGVASSKARLSHPRWQPDDASSETRKID